MPSASSAARIRGTAAAAAFSLTVMRTSSEPARASSATCRVVASTSAVSVLVIDCTTIGAAPPIVTWPTCTGTEARRGAVGMASSARGRDPGVDALLEHVERHGAAREQGVVEGADVELRSQRALGPCARLEDPELADLVGERLAGVADVA